MEVWVEVGWGWGGLGGGWRVVPQTPLSNQIGRNLPLIPISHCEADSSQQILSMISLCNLTDAALRVV